jgi:hypothetical protein
MKKARGARLTPAPDRAIHLAGNGPAQNGSRAVLKMLTFVALRLLQLRLSVGP